MLNCYDLYDIYAVLINIRSSPENPIHEKAVRCIIDVIKNRETSNEINQIRTAILPFVEIDSTGAYQFVRAQNIYTFFPFSSLKDEYVYSVLLSACEALLKVIQAQNKEQIIDLSDCLHNLPTMLVKNHYRIPRAFWKNEVKRYRKKWDKDFLKNIN